MHNLNSLLNDFRTVAIAGGIIVLVIIGAVVWWRS